MNAKSKAAKYDRQPLRVVFGSPDDPRSSIWRLWVQSDEVYFGTTDTLPHFKISLHKTGEWHAALVKSLNSSSPKGRFLKQWKRPPSKMGMTFAVAVIPSTTKPPEPFTPRKIVDTRLKWLTQAGPNRVAILFVIIADYEVDTDPIMLAQDILIGRLKKENGETVCLIAHERELTSEIAAKVSEVRNSLKINVPKDIIEKANQQLSWHITSVRRRNWTVQSSDTF
jgi:hypothetical protein